MPRQTMTPFLKLAALHADLDSHALSAEVRALCNAMIERVGQPEAGRDPKFHVNIMEDDNVTQVIVNLQPRPGDVWPEDRPG